MGLPIDRGWFDTGFFPELTSKAPSSRAQDLKGLTALLAGWARSGQAFEGPGRTGAAAADAWA